MTHNKEPNRWLPEKTVSEMVGTADAVRRTAPEVSPVADVCLHVKALAAEVEYLHTELSAVEDENQRLKMLLVRKNEALGVFADRNFWARVEATPPEPNAPAAWQWMGAADYANPIRFADKEMKADEPMDTEYPVR